MNGFLGEVFNVKEFHGAKPDTGGREKVINVSNSTGSLNKSNACGSISMARCQIPSGEIPDFRKSRKVARQSIARKESATEERTRFGITKLSLTSGEDAFRRIAADI